MLDPLLLCILEIPEYQHSRTWDHFCVDRQRDNIDACNTLYSALLIEYFTTNCTF